MLPQDPMILLSYLNTKLRDFYPTLDALCDDLQDRRGRGQSAAGRHRLPVQPGAESICLLLRAWTRAADTSAALEFFPPQRDDIPLPVCYTRVKSAEKEDIA